jgi:hypothetical protein
MAVYIPEQYLTVRLEVLTAASMKMASFWDIALCMIIARAG